MSQMNQSMLLLRGIFALLIGGAITWAVYRRDDPAFSDPDENDRRLYSPIVSPDFLFLLFGMLLVMIPFVGGNRLRNMTQALFLNILLASLIYYSVLVFLLPWLRKHFRAGVCALFWLLPQALYLLVNGFFRDTLARPLVVIRVSRVVRDASLIVWLGGAAAVLIILTVRHLRFRRSILKNAREIPDGTPVKAQWDEVMRSTGLKRIPKYRLMISSDTETPLSIGLFRPWIRVVLPKKDYTPEELQLIFRHEIGHLLRADNRTKLFLQVLTALGWFNPLIYKAVRCCSEDLELSCDELVMRRGTEEERKLYAELILKSSGRAEGITTCLSARAETLRYRLKGILQTEEKKKLVGGITAGLITAFLLFFGGGAAIACEEGTIGGAFFSEDIELVRTGFWSGGYDIRYYSLGNGKAVMERLETKKISRLTDLADLDANGEKMLTLFLRQGTEMKRVILTDRYLIVIPLKASKGYLPDSSILTDFYVEDRNSIHYVIDDPIDWEEIESLLDEQIDKGTLLEGTS